MASPQPSAGPCLAYDLQSVFKQNAVGQGVAGRPAAGADPAAERLNFRAGPSLPRAASGNYFRTKDAIFSLGRHYPTSRQILFCGKPLLLSGGAIVLLQKPIPPMRETIFALRHHFAAQSAISPPRGAIFYFGKPFPSLGDHSPPRDCSPY